MPYAESSQDLAQSIIFELPVSQMSATIPFEFLNCWLVRDLDSEMLAKKCEKGKSNGFSA